MTNKITMKTKTNKKIKLMNNNLIKINKNKVRTENNKMIKWKNKINNLEVMTMKSFKESLMDKLQMGNSLKVIKIKIMFNKDSQIMIKTISLLNKSKMIRSRWT